MYFQILTNVPHGSIAAVLMACAATWRDRTYVDVNLVILETDGLAKVLQ